MKADLIQLIPRKLTEIVELLIVGKYQGLLLPFRRL